MLTDYKIWYIRWSGDQENGNILEVGVRFYEGSMQSVTVPNFDTLAFAVTPTKTATIYLRTNLLKTLIYTPNDFGSIQKKLDLDVFLNGELAKDKTRTPISAQMVAIAPII